VLGIDVETLRLFLHVLAATVWVGGQIMLAALVPSLRRAVPEATSVAARGFARIAWPAYGVLVLTGIWNVAAETDKDPAWRHTLMVKMAFVVLSGIGAFVHQRASSKLWLALGGGFAALGAVVALLYGVRLGQ
jgi:putative copper export protein